ncbi:sensor histidine kinase [Hyalangium rubrum]|uniref:histidine kinase n=1 Tax=Hyalangium rubrum TaxID=3103134 RepID=A0ABU5H2Q0_9BACT|nr:ATP-binding protein [Hyalangium sp. s54d21]MDY7227068.1 ATP-binding protein [Hyalangium sp. s54d21]
MTPTPKQAPAPEADPEQVHLGVNKTAGLGALVINLVLLIWFWGQWSAFLAVLGVATVLMLWNLVLIEWLAKWTSRSVLETARTVLNVMGIAVVGHFTRWAAPVWIYVPYNLIWFYGLDRWVRPRGVFFLLSVDAIAWWDGAAPEVLLAFSLLGVFGFLVTEKRVELLRGALGRTLEHQQELRDAHQRLQRIHQRAVEQEKFSSLGMMAAGVAHEINNPMSFVTSNVHSLLKDLQQQPALPEPLKEYVDDVLPATLEGIRRVNAIVADLRRFARGDPDIHSEYDLNTEARTALRLAHNQLRHCQVETELGEVGTLRGRPQQIVKVLVNLLANAGQATPTGGKVRLSTRPEGGEVRVEVLDTGEGMSPEAMRHLFQPFFTTRPPGAGMGLGLAVVRGIVTAHGGRIQVESQPGQGTCVTFFLPRVPPPGAGVRSAASEA